MRNELEIRTLAYLTTFPRMRDLLGEFAKAKEPAEERKVFNTLLAYVLDAQAQRQPLCRPVDLATWNRRLEELRRRYGRVFVHVPSLQPAQRSFSPDGRVCWVK